MRRPHLGTIDYAARRSRVMHAMQGGVMVLAAAPERVRTADLHYPYRQDSDFDWLTGFPEPDAVAILAPDHAEPFVLVVRPHDPDRAIWVGPRAGTDGAVTDHSADAAHPIDELEKVLDGVLAKAPYVYLRLDRQDVLADRLHAAVRKAQANRPRSGAGPTQLREAAAILHELRLVKDPHELERMRAAIAVSADAHVAAMRTTRAGMREYEIEALVDYTFRRGGAGGPAYPSIVAAGQNATVLHHVTADRVLDTREMLLIDAGAEHSGYCADITRTFPIGLRFEGAQRDLYQAVLDAQCAAIDLARPGTTLDALHTAAVRVLAERLVGLGLLEGPVDGVIEQERYKPFYMHRTSHWLGHDVHDVGQYKCGDSPRALEEGMVFTVEPGLYVAPDAGGVPDHFRGIGIRIEDDVLITRDGHDVLTAAAPKHLADIEALRAAGA